MDKLNVRFNHNVGQKDNSISDKITTSYPDGWLWSCGPVFRRPVRGGQQHTTRHIYGAGLRLLGRGHESARTDQESN